MREIVLLSEKKLYSLYIALICNEFFLFVTC